MNPILARLGHSGGLAPGREERLLGAVSLIGREIALENKRFYAEKPVMHPEPAKEPVVHPRKPPESLVNTEPAHLPSSVLRPFRSARGR